MRLRTVLLPILLAISPTRLLVAQRVAPPEELAGQWEAPDGEGGAIGMNIWITTTVTSSATDLLSAPQTMSALTVAVYVRSASEEELHGLNSFSTSYHGGASWDGEHLRFHLLQDRQLPEIHGALTWHPASRTWTGLFERAAYRNQAITLQRPTSSQQSSFVGTWVEANGAWSSCLHIRQQANERFTAWSDQLQIPGLVRYANGLKAPEQVFERYGEPARVQVIGTDHLWVELGAYSATCCSHPFEAKLSADGQSLVGERPAGPNQAPGAVRWTRVHGGSCRSAAIRR